MFRGRTHLIALVALATLGAACDKAQLLAPTKSTITLSAATRILPSNGTTPVTAAVMEQAGTPVQNGTTVRFTTTLGRVDPVEVQTVNGLAITTFFAGPNSGIAEIRGISGAATGGTTTGTGGTTTAGEANVVRITVGSAAISTVTLRANPGNVGANGGTVELIATVVGGPADSAGAGQGAQPLEGVGVTFGVTKGVLSSATAITDANGEARTTLTTTEESVASATAGTKSATTVTVAVRPGASVSIACAVAGGAQGSTCSSTQANISNNTAIVSLTVTKGTASSSLRSATLDFGDGTSQSLGNLAAGAVTVSHAYQGPTDANPRNYVAAVTVTDVNGETASASTNITVTPRSRQLNVALTATTRTAVLGVGQPVDFEATVTPATGGADMVQTYRWSFGDGTEEETTSNKITHIYTSNGVKTATVTVTTTDGRTASTTTQFITSGI